MPEFGIRSTYSQCPFQLFLCDPDGVISTGTAFFYELDDQYFLVTNWHNFSGLNSENNEYVSPTKRCPTFITAKLSTYIDDEITPSTEFTSQTHRIDIYNDDRSKSLWLEHPDFGSKCDVVALPFTKPKNVPIFMHNAANKVSSTRIPVKAGGAVFIIGFPHSISVGFGLPIWKSGFIASEPHYDITIGDCLSETGGLVGGRVLPAFFIDALTRKGLSGSPVFAVYTGNWSLNDPYEEIDPDDKTFWSRDDIALGHTAYEFVGIYSGRIEGKEGEAALGLCWKTDVIEYICKSKQIGSFPH